MSKIAKLMLFLFSMLITGLVTWSINKFAGHWNSLKKINIFVTLNSGQPLTGTNNNIWVFFFRFIIINR